MAVQKRNTTPTTTRPFVPHHRIEPEPLGKRLLIALIGPVLVLLALLAMLTYQSPEAMLQSWLGEETSMTLPATSVASDLDGTIRTYVAQTDQPPGTYAKQAAEAGCFVDMAEADAEKLNRCGRAVYLALSELQSQTAYQKATSMLASTDRRNLVTNLQLAATITCRAKWSRGIDPNLESPPCNASGVTLARND